MLARHDKVVSCYNYPKNNRILFTIKSLGFKLVTLYPKAIYKKEKSIFIVYPNYIRLEKYNKLQAFNKRLHELTKK